MKFITWGDYEYKGQRYLIRVYLEDQQEEYTAVWRRESDRKAGESGTYFGQANHAIADAERIIRMQLDEETNAAQR